MFKWLAEHTKSLNSNKKQTRQTVYKLNLSVGVLSGIYEGESSTMQDRGSWGE